MINKLILAAVVSIGAIGLTASTSQAGDCYYRHGHPHHYRPAYRPPVTVYRSYGVYRPPVYSYVRPGYRPYSSYRPIYGSYIGPSVRFGYPGYYSRGGISIGIGF